MTTLVAPILARSGIGTVIELVIMLFTGSFGVPAVAAVVALGVLGIWLRSRDG